MSDTQKDRWNMPYDPDNGAYQFSDEQLGFPHQTSGQRPKQQLPRRDIAAAGQADDRFARDVKEEICREGERVNNDPFPLMRETPCNSLNSTASGKVTRATA